MRPGRVGVARLEQNVSQAVMRVGFQDSNADLATHGQCQLNVPGGFLVAAECQVSLAELEPDLAFICVIRVVKQGQGLLEISGRLLVTALPLANSAEPGQGEGLALVIADFAGQIQGLLIAAGRLLVAALPSPGEAQVAERAGLAQTVADLTVHGDRFLQVMSGLLVAAQLRFIKAYAGQRDSFPGAVPYVAEQGQRLPVVVSGLLKPTLLPLNAAHLRERPGFENAVAGAARGLELVAEDGDGFGIVTAVYKVTGKDRGQPHRVAGPGMGGSVSDGRY